MAYVDGSFALNPITDYAHLAGRGLMRYILPGGNAHFADNIYISFFSL